MKVLHVITGLGSGGAETQLASLVGHTRHEAEVLCLYNPGVVADRLRDAGVRVVDLGMTSNRDVLALRRLLGHIRSGRYDVVHTHLYRACLYGRAAAWLARVPVVVATEHSLQDGQLEGRTATAGVRRLYRVGEALGDRTIAVSRSVRDDLRGWGIAADRIALVPNGLDLPALAFDPAARARVRAELGIAADDQVLGTVGRLHPGKHLDELLRVSAPLLTAGRHLLVVGEGTERAALTELAAELGVADRVHLVGEHAAAPYLAAMDVFASPSPYETFGLAVLEALANGLPVVYRRCPALTELDEPVPGALPWDEDPEQVRATLGELLSRGGSTGRGTPAALTGLGMPAVAAAVDDLYEELRGRRPVRAGR